MNIKKGDTVTVITGKDAGKKGKVLKGCTGRQSRSSRRNKQGQKTSTAQSKLAPGRNPANRMSR